MSEGESGMHVKEPCKIMKRALYDTQRRPLTRAHLRAKMRSFMYESEEEEEEEEEDHRRPHMRRR